MSALLRPSAVALKPAPPLTATRACSPTQVLGINTDRTYGQVRSYGWWLQAQQRSQPAIRMRTALLAEHLGRCRRSEVDHFDLRSHGGLSRRTIQRVSRELSLLRTKDGHPHFTCLGSLIVVNNLFCRVEDMDKQLAANAHWAAIRKARETKLNKSPAARAARSRYKRKMREQARALREENQARLAAKTAPTKRQLSAKARQSGASDRHIYPRAIRPQMQQSQHAPGYIGDPTEEAQSGGMSTFHKKKEKNLTPPTKQCTGSPQCLELGSIQPTPAPSQQSELGSIQPQYELGRHPVLPKDESFAEAFPDYHSHTTQPDQTTSTQQHAVPVGTCGGGFIFNSFLEEDGRAPQPAHAPQASEARPDWLASDELQSMPSEARELWAAYTQRDTTARIRIAAKLRRSYGGASHMTETAQADSKPAPTLQEIERLQIARGEKILLEEYGFRKEHCVQATSQHVDEPSRTGEAAPTQAPARAEMPSDDKLDHLLVEIGHRKAYLRWTVLDRAKIPSYLVARAAYHLKQKLRKKQHVENIEAWLFSNARTYKERGVLPNEVIAEPRPFEDDYEAAESLAPQYTLYNEGPGARRWC